jgi:hypothetical protein
MNLIANLQQVKAINQLILKITNEIYMDPLLQK